MSNPKRLSHPLAQRGDLAGDVESGVHRTVCVVLVGLGMAEHCEQAVALGGTEMALVVVDDLEYLVAIPPDHRAVDLDVDAGGQRCRIDQIGEEDCQAPDLTVIAWGGEQFLGFGVTAVDGEHLPGERVGRLPVSAVDCPYRAIEKFVDRRLGFGVAHNPTVTTCSSGVGRPRRWARRRARPCRCSWRRRSESP